MAKSALMKINVRRFAFSNSGPLMGFNYYFGEECSCGQALLLQG